MKKIVLFSKSLYDEMPQDYREKLNEFIMEVIRGRDKALAEKIESRECEYVFSDLYFDKDDESLGQDVNENVRMKISSSSKEIIDAFCENGKGKIFRVGNVQFKMITCFDVISNVNEYIKSKRDFMVSKV